jgi:hypothetical protein
MPDGTSATTDEGELPQLLSEALGREVTLSAALPTATAEEYVIEDDEVASFDLPAGTFFDAAVVHLVTTATLDRLRSLYPVGRFEPRRFRPNIIVAIQQRAGRRLRRSHLRRAGPARRAHHGAVWPRRVDHVLRSGRWRAVRRAAMIGA